MSIVLDAGADDMRDDGSSWEVITPLESFEAVQQALKASHIDAAVAEVSLIPANYIKLEGKNAQQMVRLMETFEEHDDVQHVYSNFDIEEKELEAVSE
jgi:transcriptional/translational regulatory protein YebC/TACO1